MYSEFDFSFYDESLDFSEGLESASYSSLNAPEDIEGGEIDKSGGDGELR